MRASAPPAILVTALLTIAGCTSVPVEEATAPQQSIVAGEKESGSEVVQPPPTEPNAPPTLGEGVDAATDDDPDAGTAAQKPSSTTSTAVPEVTGTTSVIFDRALAGPVTDERQRVALAIESRVGDVTTADLTAQVLAVLNDARGWPRAGFEFVADPASPFQVVLAEGGEVDALCLPLETYSKVSCQNGPVVALNADRWRHGVGHWTDVAGYRGYLVNHEVGHLLGQRHPKPRCPVAGRPAGVMEQQTAGFEGCTGNPWPRDWEIERAAQRPVVYAPLPDWGPDPVPSNDES